MPELHPYRKEHPHSRLLTIQSIFFLGFVVFMFLITGAVTNANPGAVLLGFLPSLVFAILLIIMIETDTFYPAYNWLVMIIVLVIYAVSCFVIQVPVFQGLDVGTLLVLNAIMMTLALYILHSSFVHQKPVPEPLVKHEHKVEVHVEKPKEITEIIQSIEDKIKALNFVIGRVYSMYHGGTERIRDKIRVDKEWYNEFNQIDEADLEARKHEAIVLVNKIKERLELLEKSEKEVFGDEVEKLKNISHDLNGKDRIIHVLVKNDKDPAQQYYDGAKQFCEEALKALKR